MSLKVGDDRVGPISTPSRNHALKVGCGLDLIVPMGAGVPLRFYRRMTITVCCDADGTHREAQVYVRGAGGHVATPKDLLALPALPGYTMEHAALYKARDHPEADRRGLMDEHM
jgi:hypothetical protein